MEAFECKYIGNGLYSVAVDGVTLASTYSDEEIGELYARIWHETRKENGANVDT